LVSLVMTDMSTPLWPLHEDVVSDDLETPDGVVSAVVENLGGRVLKHTGDGALRPDPRGLVLAPDAVDECPAGGRHPHRPREDDRLRSEQTEGRAVVVRPEPAAPSLVAAGGGHARDRPAWRPWHRPSGRRQALTRCASSREEAGLEVDDDGVDGLAGHDEAAAPRRGQREQQCQAEPDHDGQADDQQR
jgi:hypothetical protein